jgi:hypothetical protein
MRERDIQSAVLDHWLKLGTPDSLVAAIPNARAFGQPGLTPGLFDLIVIGDLVGGAKIGFIELKRDAKATLSPHQTAFKSLLLRHGILYAVTHGRDQPIQALETWGAVRSQARAAA